MSSNPTCSIADCQRSYGGEHRGLDHKGVMRDCIQEWHFCWPTEEWRPIEDFPWYEVSSSGRVRHVIMLKPYATNRYPAVRLGNGKRVGTKDRPVHQLVAEAFIGPRPDGLVINHKDGDKSHNSPDNLEYVTQAENMRHATRTGLQNPKQGSEHGNALLSDDDVREIRRLRGSATQRELSILFSISPSVISHIQTRRSWRHIV